MLHKAITLSEDLELEEQFGSLNHKDSTNRGVKVKKVVKATALEKKGS